MEFIIISLKINLSWETDMKEDNSSNEKIELRSEKVRKFIGEIPQSLVRAGMIVMTICFIGLIAALCMLPYPYSNGESIIWHLIEKYL